MPTSTTAPIRRSLCLSSLLLCILSGAVPALARASAPTITIAPATIDRDGLLTMTASVGGLVDPVPGATITFTLYLSAEPCKDNPTRSKKPAKIAGSGATASYGPFGYVGRYGGQWIRATYDGDANNPAASSACERVRAAPGQGQPPRVRSPTAVVYAAVSPARSIGSPRAVTTTGWIVPPRRYCAYDGTPTVTANCIQLQCPAGAAEVPLCLRPPRSALCSGLVNVRIQRGGRTISSRRVPVKRDCTYRSHVTLPAASPRTLRVRVRFEGNTYLLPRNAPVRTISVA